jgi:hypothetical protein
MAISNGFWPLDCSVESLVLREIVPISRQNFTELRPASRDPSTPGLPPRWLYQAPVAMGGRAKYAGVHGGHQQERPRWGRSSELIPRR